MAYLGSEEATPVKEANEMEPIDGGGLHLSANDGETVAEATQIVTHKMEDGSLFIELFTKKECEKYLPYYTFSLDDAARRKLKEFLNTAFVY